MAEHSRRRSALAHSFAGWFAASHPEWSGPEVVVDRPQPGLSSDTLLLTVHHDGTAEEYVARLPPAGGGLFPDYDLGRQFRVQRAMHAAGIPAPDPLAYETDPSWIGARFLLMPRVAGHTLTTAPPYLTHGWLADAPAALQRDVIRNVIEVLAAIHRLRPADHDVGTLGGGLTLTDALDHWDAYLDWTGADGADLAIYRSALRWCRERLPERVPPPSLLWGDPQLPNVVLSERGEVRAVLDWELAACGPAELDLAWFLALHEHAAATAGRDLAGYPGRETVVGWFENALGRAVAGLDWYDVFANIRSGAIVLRVGALMRQAGHSAAWTAEVPQPRRLLELTGT